MTERWTAAEIDAALEIIRRGGTIEDLAAAIPDRTERALGIKAKRLQRVVDGEARAAEVVEQKRKEALTPAEIVAEFKRRHEAGAVVTPAILDRIARDLGVTSDHMRETMLRHWGVLSD